MELESGETWQAERKAAQIFTENDDATEVILLINDYRCDGVNLIPRSDVVLTVKKLCKKNNCELGINDVLEKKMKKRFIYVVCVNLVYENYFWKMCELSWQSVDSIYNT